jgi:hypothetical protein
MFDFSYPASQKTLSFPLQKYMGCSCLGKELLLTWKKIWMHAVGEIEKFLDVKASCMYSKDVL